MTRPLTALMRSPGEDLGACQLTYLERRGIDLQRAREQHAGLAELLRGLGVAVKVLSALEDAPDACFVEDPARVFEDVVVCARPGVADRRLELESLLPFLPQDRPRVQVVGEQATLDGGDLLRLGDVLFCGQGSRTNHAGLKELAHGVLPHGLRVKAAPVRGALHLKTGACMVAPDTVLLQPEWVDLDRAEGVRRIVVDGREPFGANALLVGEVLVMPEEHPRSVERVRAAGLQVETTAISEFLAAEAGVTCLALVWNEGT
ncbi:MAG: dimethylargininase [Planctomycetes bacterium]|nr:dimethylargininase [Planctomycetota bacterium]